MVENDYWNVRLLFLRSPIEDVIYIDKPAPFKMKRLRAHRSQRAETENAVCLQLKTGSMHQWPVRNCSKRIFDGDERLNSKIKGHVFTWPLKNNFCLR
jgi:hypothetical protein